MVMWQGMVLRMEYMHDRARSRPGLYNEPLCLLMPTTLKKKSLYNTIYRLTLALDNCVAGGQTTFGGGDGCLATAGEDGGGNTSSVRGVLRGMYVERSLLVCWLHGMKLRIEGSVSKPPREIARLFKCLPCRSLLQRRWYTRSSQNRRNMPTHWFGSHKRRQ